MSHRDTNACDDLAALAAAPGVDPCDVAVAAMPAQVLGDLDSVDAGWLERHVAECGSCCRELAAYRQVDALVGRALADSAAAPPPFRSRGARPVAWFTRVDSPIGPLLLAASDEGLCELTFEGFRSIDDVRGLLSSRGFEPCPAGDRAPAGPAGTLDRAAAELGEYFVGARTAFDLPLDFRGVTPFTRSVLEATVGVPFGRVETYRGIARRIGKPGAMRAVGGALGRNPLPVVVPCHRVVAAGGGIGGYTGGLAIKERLLAIEGTLPG